MSDSANPLIDDERPVAPDTAARPAAKAAGRAPIPRGKHARERVLRAALELLADEGITGFTMEAVASRAGASKATVYRHWASPAALLVDGMDLAFQPLPQPAAAPPAAPAPARWRRGPGNASPSSTNPLGHRLNLSRKASP